MADTSGGAEQRGGERAGEGEGRRFDPAPGHAADPHSIRSDAAEVRREARTVEIGSAVVLGGLIAIMPSVALWLMGLVVHTGGPGWEAASRAVLLVSAAAGAAVAIWWLLRARRGGL